MIRRSFLHAASRGTDTSRSHGNRKARCYAIIGPVLLTAQPHSQVCQRLQMRNYTMVCGGRGRGSERVSERKRKSVGPSPFLIRSFFLYFALFLSLSLSVCLYLSTYNLDSFFSFFCSWDTFIGREWNVFKLQSMRSRHKNILK